MNKGMDEWLTKTRYEKPNLYKGWSSEKDVPQLLNKGIVPVDKPPSMTSTAVVEWVKSLFHVSKAGHLGTLDPYIKGREILTLQGSYL